MLRKYLKKKFKDISHIYNRIGFWRLFLEVFYQKHIEFLMEKYLDDEAQKHSETDELNIKDIKQNQLTDLILFCEQLGNIGNNPATYFKKYFDNNCRGFIASKQDKVMGYLWWGDQDMVFNFKDHDFKLIRDEIKFNEEDVYLFDIYIAPQYRGKGFAFELQNKVNLILKNRGYNRLIMGVRQDNLPSVRLLESFYFKTFKQITVRRFFLFILLKNEHFYFDKYGHKSLFTLYDFKKEN